MKKHSNIGLNIGLSSILVIIVILCLVCFACLSLASSNADYQLSDKLSKRTSSYYEAASMAYKDMADINKESSAQANNSFDNTYPINDNQVLHVCAYLHPADEINYQVTSFFIQTIKEPELDNSLSLLLGN